MPCGSSTCNCGENCQCKPGECKCMYPDLGSSESTTTVRIIAGLAPVNMFYERSEMNFGAENGCKCGSNCTCDPCSCK